MIKYSVAIVFLIASLLLHAQEISCSSGRYILYIDSVEQAPQYSQSYTALSAAVNIAIKTRKQVVIKNADTVCKAIFASLSSVSSSRSSSSVSACRASPVIPFYRTIGTTWIPGSFVNVSAGAQIELGPQPYTGSWSWSGCGVTGLVREQTVRPSASCKITATHTNTCGTKSTHEFSINVGSTSSQSSSSRTSSSASTVIVSWQHPTKRENGKVLELSEIGGYEIRQGLASYKIVGNQITQRQIPNNGGKLEIATYDTQGLYSLFVEVKQ